MNKDELMNQFMRVTPHDTGYMLEIAVLEWHDSHTPVITWQTFRKWDEPPSVKEVLQAKRHALRLKRFFRICQYCNELKREGHMLDKTMCYNCGTRVKGVIY